MLLPAGRLLASLILASSLVAVGCASASDNAADPASGDSNLSSPAPLGADPKGAAARYPIVLVSGFATSPTFNSFRGVAEAFRLDGHHVRVANLPPIDSTAVRGAALAKEIDATLKEFGASKVNIVAHSSGGTDAREVISKLGYGDRVASVTTISTAHQGSPLADLVLDAVGGVGDQTLDAIATFLGTRFSDMAKDSHFRAGFESMAVRNMPSFNASHPDDPRVYYQSWAGVAGLFGDIDNQDDAACENKRFGGKRINGVVHVTMAPMALAMRGRAQDAMVPVESAKHGVFRGCIPADHLDELGGNANAPAIDPHSGFDHVRFYRLTAYELAAKGF